jgi:outer membrane protein insertion porin family/translocation and assembly module TamA
MLDLSCELRFTVSGPLSAVLFADASDVSRATYDLRLRYPHLSVGPWLRYRTPVGPVRIDFGWRVPGAQKLGGALDPRETPREFSLLIHGPFALHLSLGESF